MKRTLGGERLGSGNKMKVDMHGFERSTHDLGYIWRSTMSAGTLVPFMKEIALPGDTFDIDLDCDIKTHPTLGPLFGSYKVQLDVFEAPIRLYQGWLHNNKLGIGLKMNTVKLPIYTAEADTVGGLTQEEIGDIDNYQVNPSALLAYLGMRGIGTNQTAVATATRQFNAVPLLAYWDIYKNYYANKQEEIGVVIHTPAPTVQQNVSGIQVDDTFGNTYSIPQGSPGTTIPLVPGSLIIITNSGTAQDPNQIIIYAATGGSPIQQTLANIATFVSVVGNVQTYLYQGGLGVAYISWWEYQSGTSTAPTVVNLVQFDLNKIDEMREYLLTNLGTSQINIRNAGLEPYILQFDSNSDFRSLQATQEGLGIKTYQSDIFNNWLETEWIDGTGGITEVTSIDTTGGSFTIDTLNLARKVYDMLNRIAVSGGTYDDWKETVWAHEGYRKCETPMYHGGLSKELVFQEVVSNAEAGSAVTQPLGTLAGKGVMSNKHKGGKCTIKVDEPGYIIGIISLTPRIDYSQGNDWDIHLDNMDDLHKPSLDEIGFQELITEQMAWWDTYYDNTGLGVWVQRSAGKQPAWINYMTNYNRIRGNFAIQSNEMFMVLNRSYKPNFAGTSTGGLTIQDLTTYVDPRIYNQIFADTSLDSQNFWAQIKVDMTVRRKISAKVMPNL